MRVSLLVQTLVQPLEQAGAADHFTPKRRQIELRGEQGRRHSVIIVTTVFRRQLQRLVRVGYLCHRDVNIAISRNG